MGDNKKQGLNKVGSTSINPAQILKDKKKIIAAIPHKNPRGKRSVTIQNQNAWDVYVCLMNNKENLGQYNKLSTLKADGTTVVPYQPITANGVIYSTSHSAGIDGFREVCRHAEMGFVGITLDCQEDDYVDQFKEQYNYAWISDSLDGPVSFPLGPKVTEAKSKNNQELQSRDVEFAGVLNQSNDLVFILKAGRTLMVTPDFVHVARSVR